MRSYPGWPSSGVWSMPRWSMKSWRGSVWAVGGSLSCRLWSSLLPWWSSDRHRRHRRMRPRPGRGVRSARRLFFSWGDLSRLSDGADMDDEGVATPEDSQQTDVHGSGELHYDVV